MQRTEMLFFDHNPMPLFLIDGESLHIREVNQRALEIYGYKREEIIQKQILHFHPAKEHQQVVSLFKGNTDICPENTEFTHVTKGDAILYVEYRIQNITYQSRECLIVAIIDITHRKKAETALDESRVRLAEAQEMAKMGRWDYYHKENALFWSDSIFSIFGLEKTEKSITYETYLESVHPEDREKVNLKWKESLYRQSRFQVEHRIITPRGDLKWMNESCHTEFDETGNPIHTVGIVQDITDLVKTEKALRKSEERYKGIINSQHDIVVRLDTQNRFTFVNETYCKTFGKTKEELLGRSFTPVIHEDDLKATLLAMENLSNPPFRAYMEQRAMTVNGWRWLAWEDYAVRNSRGEVIEIQGVGRDITELKAAESALKDALAMEKKLGELKSRFVSMASHEFRTPLASMMMATETLENYRQRLSEEEILKYLGRIRRNIEYLRDIIGKVLSLSRIESGKIPFTPEKTDLNHLLTHWLNDYRDKNQLEHQIEFEPFQEYITIDADRQLLIQALENMVSNSRKYAPEGTKIIINVNRINNFVTLSVTDFGIGIPEKEMEFLFDPFFRASNVVNYHGTGLGLPLIKQIVDRHKGSIRLESEINKKTTFHIDLPVQV
jgi:PAS domain S-box-containing protein